MPVHVSVYVTVPAAAGVTSCVPVAACAPVHPPLAVQAVFDDHVSVALCPAMMVVGATEIVAVAAGGLDPPPPPPPQPANAAVSAESAMNLKHFDAMVRCVVMT